MKFLITKDTYLWLYNQYNPESPTVRLVAPTREWGYWLELNNGKFYLAVDQGKNLIPLINDQPSLKEKGWYIPIKEQPITKERVKGDETEAVRKDD